MACLPTRDLVGIPPLPQERVDFEQVNKLKGDLLQRAYEHYRQTTDTRLRSACETFCER